MDPAPPVVVEDKGQIRTLRIGRIEQSSMYLDAPFDTDFDYPAYLHLTLAVTPAATRVLMIGLGGGTIVKRMWRDYPLIHIDVAEVDPRVAELARTHFALPDDERIVVHVGDGRKLLESTETTYDIVIVDAFDDDRVPLPLVTEEFGRSVITHLEPDGVLAYNFHGSVSGDRSKPFRRLHRTLATSFSSVWVFPVGLSSGGPVSAHREIIALATNSGLTTDGLLANTASRVDGRVTVPGFERFGDDLYRGPMRTGDVRTYCDPVR